MNNVDNLNHVWPEWRIIERVGTGSYGRVYKAVRNEYSTPVYSAIKILTIPDNTAEILELKAEGLDEKALKEYYRQKVKSYISEIELMETFKGTANVVNIEDYKVVEKKDSVGFDIYIRMELLTSFNKYIEYNSLTKKEIIKLGIDICTALESFEQKNILHRDIKPENLFITEYGDFKVGDLGVARKLDPEVAALSAKGTYSYMAPEVVYGKSYNIRADIYSLGLVLYKVCNKNRLPFVNTDSDEIDMGERKNINSRRLKGEKLPNPVNADEDMAAVILHACEYSPDERFQTPTEFKNALTAIDNGEKVIFNNQKYLKIKLKIIVGIIVFFLLSIMGSILIWGELEKSTSVTQTEKITNSKEESKTVIHEFTETENDMEMSEENSTIDIESDASESETIIESDTSESEMTIESDTSELGTESGQSVTNPTETTVQTETKTDAEFEGYVVPEGCTYSAGGMIYTEGMKVDTPPTYNHVLITKDYTYSYGVLPWSDWNEPKRFGWDVQVNNREQTEYEELLGSIAGEKLIRMAFTYENCVNMKNAPKIPEGVEDMIYTYNNCDSLEVAPVIPKGVKEMTYTFLDCDSLKLVPVIPDGIEEMYYTFDDCNNLETVSEISGSVKSWQNTFNNCTKLSYVPDIPQGAYSLEGTFNGCSSLKTSPSIPEGVENMNNTFYGCVSLEKAPTIPASVKNLLTTFCECVSLKETPVISNGVTSLNRTFFDCEGLVKVTNIPDSVESMIFTFHNCVNLEDIPVIPANMRDMEGTFAGCKSITETPYIQEGIKTLKGTFERCDKLITVTNIPDSVTAMEYTFSFCCELQYVPELPQNITNMEGTFVDCKKLSEAPEIPKYVTNMKSTFEKCEGLRKASEIPDNVMNMEYTFAWCSNLEKAPVIPASVTNMTGTFCGGGALTGEVIINANPIVYDDCFKWHVIDDKNLTLTGSSTMLEELRSTSED